MNNILFDRDALFRQITFFEILFLSLLFCTVILMGCGSSGNGGSGNGIKNEDGSEDNTEDILPPIATAMSLYDMREKTNYAQQKNCNTKPPRKKAHSKHVPDITRSSGAFVLTINNGHHNYSTKTK